MAGFVTYTSYTSSAPTVDVKEDYVSRSSSVWQNLNNRLAALENENAHLRAQTLELSHYSSNKSLNNTPASPTTVPLNYEAMAQKERTELCGKIEELEKHIRELQQYIIQLEKVSVPTSAAAPDLRNYISRQEAEMRQKEAIAHAIEQERLRWEQYTNQETNRIHRQLRDKQDEYDQYRRLYITKEDDLSQQLMTTKNLLEKSEDILRETKTRWENSERERELAIKQAKEVETVETKYRDQHQQLKYRAALAEAEMEAVRKWRAQKQQKRGIQFFNKPFETEPWKPFYQQPSMPASSPIRTNNNTVQFSTPQTHVSSSNMYANPDIRVSSPPRN